MTNIALLNINRKAEMLRMDAEAIVRYARTLSDLPEFDTAAEAAIRNAELALSEALFAVKISKSEIAAKRGLPLEGAE